MSKYRHEIKGRKDRVADITSNIIAACSVLVTFIFSLAVWKATKETAEAAKATLKLSEDLAGKEERRINDNKRIMRRLLLPIIAKESKVAYDAVVDINPVNIFRKLREAPISLSIDKHELAEYFSVAEVSIIIKAWETYGDYRRKYLKDVYQGNEIKILLEKAEPVKFNFNALENVLMNIKI